MITTSHNIAIVACTYHNSKLQKGTTWYEIQVWGVINGFLSRLIHGDICGYVTLMETKHELRRSYERPVQFSTMDEVEHYLENREAIRPQSTHRKTEFRNSNNPSGGIVMDFEDGAIDET